MLRYIEYFGIPITPTEEMQFDKWKTDRNNCPAFNTISQEERVGYLIKFLEIIRNKQN